MSSTSVPQSLADRLAGLPPEMRKSIIESLSPEEQEQLKYEWRVWARPSQLPPEGDWRAWLYMAGRGSGKTRTGTEWIRTQIESGRCRRVALIAPTANDVRAVLVEGQSGLLAICPDWNRPKYNPTLKRLTWPNGAIASLYSADEPDRLRGPQHDACLCDEYAAWKRPQAFDMMLLGLRLGENPQAVITTTPKPVPHIQKLIKWPSNQLVITRGTTWENAANLAPGFLSDVLSQYANTRLGAQEIEGLILTETSGSLWTREVLERNRVEKAPEDLVRIVVAVDPAVTYGDDADETGIVVVARGADGHGYVLADRSCIAPPAEWARRAIEAYREFNADRIVAEVNQGGALVENTLRVLDQTIPYTAVRASRGKQARAEPIAAMYEQNRIHHVGTFPQLEDQLCTWVPGAGMESPDRLDGLVWGCSEALGIMMQANYSEILPPTLPFVDHDTSPILQISRTDTLTVWGPSAFARRRQQQRRERAERWREALERGEKLLPTGTEP